jgi:hypothetical protein
VIKNVIQSAFSSFTARKDKLKNDDKVHYSLWRDCIR